ncbi:transmembrane protein 26 [Cylas formicarius]|uniref:transmembrane protein 26 n=1 Tax=Cylas formicarius TaxID=197179 RepID=UPI002958C12F|nr:transmembrane protein 26 [Cylas formicarius]
MARFVATVKAVITRVVFATHGIVGIWQVTIFKKNSYYWYLSSPILLLFFEGIFTLTIKENQEWKWFCPSVFLYLASIVPAIWLLELDKVDKRMKAREELETPMNFTDPQLKELHNLIGVGIKLPDISLSTETWITLIEQFLMLILIIGRWMLPKGDLTRDQLSQLLLVYIGTAADIIEFFDSFKDDKIAAEPILVLLTLAIWSWSLMQFTVVLTATKSRKSRLTSTRSTIKKSGSCCTIDVWGIALNITLQDAPFLVFRLLLITHFKIISYMNVFFTCKNTLVILLQLYRLYVVYSEHNKKSEDFNLTDISIISKSSVDDGDGRKRRRQQGGGRRGNPGRTPVLEYSSAEEVGHDEIIRVQKKRKIKGGRKDTGYSTGSSHTSARRQMSHEASTRKQRGCKTLSRSDRETREGGRRPRDNFAEESDAEEPKMRRAHKKIAAQPPTTSDDASTE